MDVMMQLGTFKFIVPEFAYQQWEQQNDYRHNRHDRMNKAPLYHFTGVGEESINLSGNSYLQLGGGRPKTAQLRTMASTGEAYSLIDGKGNILGKYVITNVGESQEIYFTNGIPRRVDFTLNLLRQG
jgi:phage protein U